MLRKTRLVFAAGIIGLLIGSVPLFAGQPSLESWKPDFDPSTASYRCIVSCVGHPAIKGVFAGYAIRDRLWEKTGGQIYFDFKPLSVLGGEVEVMNQLQMGAIQGMAISSVASTNLGPRFGLVNLPFLINTFDKLEGFVKSEKLFDHYMMAMDHQGIVGLDITGYGHYGWATTTPVTSLDDARKVKFRIAEAAVNNLLYNQWGFNPVVMPWPDVPIALKQGVITGLDHTPIVCNISRKFEVAKYYTEINYAQGLYIWVFNKAWYNALPKDLKNVFTETVHEVCADMRRATRQQELDEIAAARSAGIRFLKLPEKDMQVLKSRGDAVHRQYADQINQLYPGDIYRPNNYLLEVQKVMNYN